MGVPDLYPFVLSGSAIEKLRFVHGVLNVRRDEGGQQFLKATAT